MTPSPSVRSSIVRATVRLARETASLADGWMDDSLSRPPARRSPSQRPQSARRNVSTPRPSERALIAIGWALMISQLAAKTAATSVTNACMASTRRREGGGTDFISLFVSPSFYPASSFKFQPRRTSSFLICVTLNRQLERAAAGRRGGHDPRSVQLTQAPLAWSGTGQRGEERSGE